MHPFPPRRGPGRIRRSQNPLAPLQRGKGIQKEGQRPHPALLDSQGIPLDPLPAIWPRMGTYSSSNFLQ